MEVRKVVEVEIGGVRLVGDAVSVVRFLNKNSCSAFDSWNYHEENNRPCTAKLSNEWAMELAEASNAVKKAVEDV